MLKFVNLTPHSIKMGIPQPDSDTGEECIFETVPPSGTVARVATNPGSLVCHFMGVEVYSPPAYGFVEGLPAAEEGTVFIVSTMVAGRLVNRPDVVSPGTGPSDGARRDEKGHISWVTRLIRSC